MLSPEVWSFSPPGASKSFKKSSSDKKADPLSSLIKYHHFNHLVSVVIPSTTDISDNLTESLIEDSSYYRVENINLVNIVNKEFIESFVKHGNLYILSDGTHIDTDDCMCVTPCGHLILSVKRDTYVTLGLEGTPSVYCRKTPSRYVINIDLKAESFTPGKKFYEKVRTRLANNFRNQFDVLITWEPPDATICPSSIAAYLEAQGNSVDLCRPKYVQRIAKEVKVPVLDKNIDEHCCEYDDVLEWLGAFSLNIDLKTKSSNEYVSMYETPHNNISCAQVVYLQWTGFFSVEKIQKLCKYLKTLVEIRASETWISLHVQGFDDSPVSWNLSEHTFYTDGDNSYTVFLKPTSYFTSSLCSSYRMPHAQSKKKKRKRKD